MKERLRLIDEKIKHKRGAVKCKVEIYEKKRTDVDKLQKTLDSLK